MEGIVDPGQDPVNVLLEPEGTHTSKSLAAAD
jgi:hypothetical protein